MVGGNVLDAPIKFDANFTGGQYPPLRKDINFAETLSPSSDEEGGFAKQRRKERKRMNCKRALA